ncbi:hypothetical protein ACE2AK_18445 [Rahnella perminowiae]|uniref:hypothetical protein n=1 Tax=Rahnella TaxID=34037 RepID=UPI001020523F|nr:MULTISPECIES: hypothetical protein [Rahnella]MCR9003590.1 hypothetical protein [Rahnella perminowiae]MCX2945650.1 hypothetical protein [Rahnella perminowiae]
MSDDKDNGSNIHPIIKALDLAWESSLLMKFLFYCLFLDLACFHVIGRGLWLVTMDNISEVNLGGVFGGFFFWALMLVILDFFRVLLKITLGSLLSYKDNYRKSYGVVSPYELLTEAVKTGSDVYYKLHVKAKEIQKNRVKSRRRKEIACLGVLLLLFIESIQILKSGGSGLFLEWVYRIINSFSENPISQGSVSFIACLISIASVIIIYISEEDLYADYVECAPLYNKLNNK